MNTIPPAETLQFHLGPIDNRDKDFIVNYFKEVISEFDNAEDFRDTHIIAVENESDGNWLQNCYGVTIAMNILRKDSKAKVILQGVIPVENIRVKKPEIDLVLRHDNAFWIKDDYNLATEYFQKIFQTKKSVQLGGYTVSKEVQNYLSKIFHDLNYVKNWDNPAEDEKGKFEETINLVKDYFPALTEKTPQEIIAFLRCVSENREDVMKGQKITGVYCDIEGTLLISEKLNEKAVSLLDAYANEGKAITIWTDGNLETIEPLLRSLGVIYPLKSKMDFAGAIAEIVIDDQDEYTFAARTKISAEKFIRTSDLN